MKELIIIFRHYLYLFAVNFLFKPLKNILLKIINYLESHGVNEHNIGKIIFFLSCYYSRSLQIAYLPPVDITSRLKDNGDKDKDDKFCLAKPQYYHEEYNFEFYDKKLNLPLVLDSAKVIGSSNFTISKKSEIIYELHYLNKEGNFSYSDPAFFLFTGKKFVIRYKNSNEKFKNGIFLGGNFSANFYHFLLEVIPKFWLLDKITIPSDVPLLVDDAVKKIPQLLEILEYFNAGKRQILYLDGGHVYDVATLYYLPMVNFIPPDYADVRKIRYEDCFFNLNSLAFVRNKLLPQAKESFYGKRVYLSRKNSMSRRRCNEDEVIKVFEKYGIEICYPENLSVAQQISLFSQADFVAGVTGAAFTNLIFAKPGCKALCLQSFVLDLSIFSTIAKFAGVDLQYYSAHDRDYVTDDLHEKFTVDVADLERVLVDFLKR